MKIKGIKKAIGDYRRTNSGGIYSPRYGELMLNTESGKIWTDEHYDIGHGSYTVYEDAAIVNLGAIITDAGQSVNMNTAKMYALKLCNA